MIGLVLTAHRTIRIKMGQADQVRHYGVYAFTHYSVHNLFGWELGQLVFIAKKGV